MKIISTHHLPRILNGAIAVLLFGSQAESVHAGTFNWANIAGPGNFTDSTKWMGGLVPTGMDASDILVFGGDVGTNLANTSYTATNNSATIPFLLNQIMLDATNAIPGTGPSQTIAGNSLLFGGVNPTITQNNTASVVINPALRLGANLLWTGSPVLGVDTQRDKANVTLNGTLSGNFDITKSGTSTFRFGSAGGTSVSENTWFGKLTINDGTIRFNNNAYTAPTALRSNPVVMNLATALLTTQFKQLDKTIPTPANRDPESSLRFGTLSGSAGTVEARRETATVNLFDSADITITAITSGTFGGTLRNQRSATTASNSGDLSIRGVGTQTFTAITGILDISKDVKIGDIATMVLSGNASLSTTSLGTQTAGAIILSGGSLRLDNTTTNNPNRLRNGDSGSTGLDTVGGGTLSLIGNAAGTAESASRIQLGSGGTAAKPRSGALTINITQPVGAAVGSSLNFESYSRDAAGNPYNTVNFTANTATGTPLALGTAAATGPRVTFNTITGTAFFVPTFNGLLGNTGAANATSVGWATVNGSDFASYPAVGGNGVIAVAPTVAPGSGTIGSDTANIAITSNFALTNENGYQLNSLKMAPTAAGQALDLASAGNLFTNAFLLSGTTDFAITSTGGGAIANVGGIPGATSPRYFHVSSAMLTVSASVFGVSAPLVKAGAGTLVLTNTNNASLLQPVVLNEGTLRATLTSLPAGELRFRGGVLEISNGGTFTRQLGQGSSKLNWSGVDAGSLAIGDEQGSGGFAAVGFNATVNLTPLAGGSDFSWEDTGFVNSGHALVFGSARADAKLTWVNNISLTSIAQVVNYNARQFRAIDNPNSTTDIAVLSGTISGTVRNDFLKSGNGELILTGNNTFFGATLVTNGTLRVNGSTRNSFLTDVSDGATLGGSGTVAGVQVENNGTLAPGDLTGRTSILSLSNLNASTPSDLKFTGSGAKLAIELGGTTAGGNGTSGYDRVNVNGGVTLSGAQLNGSLLNGFTALPDALFFIIVNDGSDAVQGAFAQGNLVTIGAQIFNIGYTGNFDTNTFTGGNDVVLQIVPEPGTASLLLLSALGFAQRRQRRR